MKGKNNREKKPKTTKEGTVGRPRSTFQTDMAKKLAEMQRRLLRVRDVP